MGKAIVSNYFSVEEIRRKVCLRGGKKSRALDPSSARCNWPGRSILDCPLSQEPDSSSCESGQKKRLQLPPVSLTR